MLDPLSGFILYNEDLNVVWSASDENGDQLRFNVEYSTDGCSAWQVVGLFLEGDQIWIPADNLPASSQARVRVTATDGIHSTSAAMAGNFEVLNHPPSVEITNPTASLSIAAGQTIYLEGLAYDIDLGFLDGNSLTWESDLDNFLGNGASLVLGTDELSLGQHEITLTADDGQGGVASDSLTVTVEESPNDLPASENQLVVDPPVVLLQPLDGVSNSPISIENQNRKVVMDWSVSSVSQSWVLLGASSGNTPQDITLSLDLSQLRYSTYTADVTFTSRSGGNPVTIQVVVELPEYRLEIPDVRK